MNWKKRRLRDSRLYVVIDRQALKGRSLLDMADEASSNGADIIQLRDKHSDKKNVFKDAQALRKIIKKNRALFIINDYLDIARLVDCDGVHLGQHDIPIEMARELLGRDKIIGISCFNLKEAKIAQDSKADYLGIGPVFLTPIKPQYQTIDRDLIRECKMRIKIPFFIIGGVNEKNIKSLKNLGADRVAVCRSVCQARNVPQAIKKLTAILDSD